MKKIVLLAVALAVVWFWQRTSEGPTEVAAPPGRGESAVRHDAIANAHENQASGVQVMGAGEVTRILPDDHDGSRHQRFILALDSGLTVLVAHNIDLAPRIESLREGDSVSFNGVYEWNDRGGVVHWTHHDPDGRHEPGWLRHDDRIYQ
jgi:hypothetical protein